MTAGANKYDIQSGSDVTPTGVVDVSYHCYEPSCRLATQTRDVKPMLIRWWLPSSTSAQHLSNIVNVSWFVGVTGGCRCFPFTQLYTLGSVRGWSSCTIRPTISEDILHKCSRFKYFFYTNDKRLETCQLNATI